MRSRADIFERLKEISARPPVFHRYTAADLWTGEHSSARMLAFHLDGCTDKSSRKLEFIERSVDWLVRRFGLSEGRRVIDFGCGPGLYTTRIAASGASVTGIDFSPRSVQYAREAAVRQELDIDHVLANYLEYETDERFDLVVMIMCDFCVLSPAQRTTMLAKFRGLLEPDGALLFDVWSLHAFDEREESATYAPGLLDGFWSPDPHFGFRHTFKYDAEKVVLDKYTIIEEKRVREIYNWLQHYDPESLSREIEDNGLVIEEFVGDVAGAAFDPTAPQFAVIVRKPG